MLTKANKKEQHDVCTLTLEPKPKVKMQCMSYQETDKKKWHKKGTHAHLWGDPQHEALRGQLTEEAIVWGITIVP